jgi:hypothetical protein
MRKSILCQRFFGRLLYEYSSAQWEFRENENIDPEDCRFHKGLELQNVSSIIISKQGLLRCVPQRLLDFFVAIPYKAS